MKTIFKYFATVIGLSIAIWMMTLGSYNLYKSQQVQVEFTPKPVQAQSSKSEQFLRTADTLYQKTTDVMIQNAQ